MNPNPGHRPTIQKMWRDVHEAAADRVPIACVNDECHAALTVRREHKDHFEGRWLCPMCSRGVA